MSFFYSIQRFSSWFPYRTGAAQTIAGLATATAGLIPSYLPCFYLVIPSRCLQPCRGICIFLIDSSDLRFCFGLSSRASETIFFATRDLSSGADVAANVPICFCFLMCSLSQGITRNLGRISASKAPISPVQGRHIVAHCEAAPFFAARGGKRKPRSALPLAVLGDPVRIAVKRTASLCTSLQPQYGNTGRCSPPRKGCSRCVLCVLGLLVTV